MNEQIEKLEINAQSVINSETLEEIVQNPVVHYFMELIKSSIPYAESLESAIQKVFQKRQKEKIQSLLEGISNIAIADIPTERLLQANVVNEWCLIYETVKKITSKEKIRTLGRLYSNMYLGKEAPAEWDDDLFEEWVSILSDMSDREIDILLSLRKYENPHLGKGKSHYIIASLIWDDFEKDIMSKYHINQEEFYSILQRLVRTGFYRNDLAEVGALDRGVNKFGYTTEYFNRFFMKVVNSGQ